MRHRGSYLLLLALTIGPAPQFAWAAQLPGSTPAADRARTVSLRALFEAVRGARDGEYVTVQGTTGEVRVSKQAGYLLVREDKDSTPHRVEVQVPLTVVEALLAAGSDQLDLVAAIRALAVHGDKELVTVKDEKSTVRIWLDSKSSVQSSGTANPHGTAESKPLKKGPRATTKSLDGNSLRASWAPPDVGNGVPAVAAGVACSQEEVLEAASQRVQELATNLQQFTATERVEHLDLDKRGKARPETRAFSYLASIRKVGVNLLAVEEYRNGDASPDVFPARLATIGLPAFALVFHPALREEFEMSCEGLGQWRQQPAWQIYFQSRLDRPAHFREYKVGAKRYPVRLKGRAWIAADTHQVLHMETDLLGPIPEIPLQLEHLTIEYRPVEFAKRHIQVWLPQLAEVYMDYRGHRLLRRHAFSDFMLFSVDVTQQIQSPTQQP